MSRIHSQFLVSFLLISYSSLNTIISAIEGDDDDPTIKTMHQFSGYPSSEPHHHSLSSLSVDTQSLQNQIDELATISDSPAPSVTRVLYTEKDVAARRYIKNLMGLAGLSVREDTIGNIFGRWDGYEPELAAVGTGSHIDAIPYSGKYDGVVGVLGAIEAINVLKKAGFKPKLSLEVIMFTSEEPTSFGTSCLGSRLIAGRIPIGVVTAIAAPASIKVDFEGDGGHAGAALMPNRNDAGLAGAELALAVEKHVLDSGSIDTVGTVGILDLHPRAVNSIPSKAHVEIDTRDINETRRNIVVEKIHQSAVEIANKRKVKLTGFEIVNQDPPALADKKIIEAMEASSKELRLDYKLMVSRAYHDSLFMARVSPMGMIFIPCYKGYSHKPEEYSAPEDLTNGVKVLALTLARLSLS